jgi:hypothetical protein
LFNRGPHHRKSPINSSSHRIARSTRGRGFKRRFRARGRELPCGAERAGTAWQPLVLPHRPSRTKQVLVFADRKSSNSKAGRAGKARPGCHRKMADGANIKNRSRSDSAGHIGRQSDARSIQGDAQASRQPGADAVGWPDPPSPAGGAAQGGTAESTPEGRANQTQEVPATAANSDKNAGNDARGERHVEMAASHSEMPVGMLLAFAIGLVIAGIFVRRIVRMTFARRRTVRPDRREPVWTTRIASERTKPKLVVMTPTVWMMKSRTRFGKSCEFSTGKRHKAHAGVATRLRGLTRNDTAKECWCRIK